jgi:hypothetical protein
MVGTRSMHLAVVTGLICVTFFSACATVSLVEKPSRVLSLQPTATERADFFFWGLVGHHETHLNEICGSIGVDKVETQYTAPDVFWGILTLGIFSPRSVRVWCSV